MGSRNRVGIGLSYRLAGLHSLAELIRWNRFLGSINVLKFGLKQKLSKSAKFSGYSLTQPPAALQYDRWGTGGEGDRGGGRGGRGKRGGRGY
jgi:hypothetical protein